MSCPDLKLPVPCADGNCHSDYISCLRVRTATRTAEACTADSATVLNCPPVFLCQAITSQAEDFARQQEQQRSAVDSAVAEHVQQHSRAVVDSNIVAAMKSVVGQFNDRGATSRNYEDFFKEMQQQ
jgi:hypothetical protein